MVVRSSRLAGQAGVAAGERQPERAAAAAQVDDRVGAGEPVGGDDQIAFALLDLPLAAVRRHLLAGEAPPKRVTTLVKNMVGLVLGVPAD